MLVLQLLHDLLRAAHDSLEAPLAHIHEVPFEVRLRTAADADKPGLAEPA